MLIRYFVKYWYRRSLEIIWKKHIVNIIHIVTIVFNICILFQKCFKVYTHIIHVLLHKNSSIWKIFLFQPPTIILNTSNWIIMNKKKKESEKFIFIPANWIKRKLCPRGAQSILKIRFNQFRQSLNLNSINIYLLFNTLKLSINNRRDFYAFNIQITEQRSIPRRSFQLSSYLRL